MNESEPFAKLFKRYRLRSEFETLSEFGDVLADHNLIYENSIFSHWQKGTRVPKDRKLIYTIIKIFSDRKGIVNEDEANSFMASTGLGYLTKSEIEELTLPIKKLIPFQVPRKNDIFIGREDIILSCEDELKNGNVVILTGQPGVGKTSLAILLGHKLKSFFEDGVLWCSCETNSPLSILHLIAQSFGEILPLNATEREASLLCRSLICDKKALFIFDGVNKDTPLELLLPSSSQSSVIITSAYHDIGYSKYGTLKKLNPFTEAESQALFESIIPRKIVEKSLKSLKKLSKEVGNLPLALHILAKQVSLKLKESELVELVNNPSKLTSLYSSLELCYLNLPKKTQLLLSVCSIYNGSDFSFDSLKTASQFSTDLCNECVDILIQYSLLEQTAETRFTLHPLIKKFLRERQVSIKYYKNLAQYYIEYMRKYQSESNYFSLMASEVENIIGLIRICISKNLETEASELWKIFGGYYWHVGPWRDFKDISSQIYNIAEKNKNYELLLAICLEEVSRLYYYDGNITRACAKAREGLALADRLNNGFWTALAHQRYGKLCFMNNSVDEGLKHLSISSKMFEVMKNSECISHNLRYLSEGYVLQKNNKKANELLQESLKSLKKVENKMRRTIYESVIYSHLGVLEYSQEKYKEARIYFMKGLASDKKYPLVRGTYTWLNKLGLALSFRKLGFKDEAQQLLLLSQKQRKQLGIENSFQTINVYSALLAKEIS
jgi:tetratricopeptide (TPR) repeat protein